MQAVLKGLFKWTLVGLMLVVALNINTIAVQSQRSPARGGEREDSCHMREIELCTVSALSIMQNPNGLPMSQPELKRQCEYLNESVNCFKDYCERCLTGSQRKLTNMFFGSGIKLAADFCDAKSDLRQNYTRHVECFRKIQREYQRTCMSDFQVAFEGIHKMNHSQRLPLICCNVNRLKECIFVPLDDECGLAASATVEGVLETLFGSVMNLTCRNYNFTNQECAGMLPKIGTKPHNGRNTSALSRVISGMVNVPAQM